MKNDTSQRLKDSLSSLLKEGLSEREEQKLTEEGFILKKPTRIAAIAIALYKKAAAGDLNAIKELRGMLFSDLQGADEKGVRIIDDIGD